MTSPTASTMETPNGVNSSAPEHPASNVVESSWPVHLYSNTQHQTFPPPSQPPNLHSFELNKYEAPDVKPYVVHDSMANFYQPNPYMSYY